MIHIKLKIEQSETQYKRGACRCSWYTTSV